MSSTVSPSTTAERSRPVDGWLGEQRIVLDGVSWDTYERLLDEKRNPGVRLSYDRGRLEMMAPSRMHEKYKRLLGRIIETLAEELDLPIDSGSSMTFRRREASRGLESDECYWIENAAAVTGKETIDFASDPPPDIAIEIDMTSSSFDKLAVYATLGVPEVWQYDGRSLRVVALQSRGDYEQADSSLSFPDIPLEQLAGFLERWHEMDETAWIKAFRQWVRERDKR